MGYSVDPNYRKYFDMYKKRLQQADAAFTPGASQTNDGSVSIPLGYKGLINIEFSATGEKWRKGPQTHAIHAMANCLIESPAWRLIQALSTIVSGHEQKINIENFYKTIQANQQERELARKIIEIKKNKHWEEFIPGLNIDTKSYNDYLDHEEDLFHYWFKPSFNINGIKSGYIGPGTDVFRLPNKAQAICDIRIPKGYTTETTIKNIENHFHKEGFADIDINIISYFEPFQTDKDTDLIKSLESVLNDNQIHYIFWPYGFQWWPLVIIFRAKDTCSF